MDNKYTSFFNAIKQEHEKLTDSLPNELRYEYEQYLEAVNAIVDEKLRRAGYGKKAAYSVYEICCRITLEELMESDEIHYDYITVFIEIYAVTSFNNNIALAIDATVRLLYNDFYLT